MITDIARKFAVIACTIVMSAACMLGALAPATTTVPTASTQIVA